MFFGFKLMEGQGPSEQLPHWHESYQEAGGTPRVWPRTSCTSSKRLGECLHVPQDLKEMSPVPGRHKRCGGAIWREELTGIYVGSGANSWTVRLKRKWGCGIAKAFFV